MGWRFRRSWSVIPGVRVNLGRKSGSLSFGVRGLHYTVGTSGSRITAGIPGTGLFWTHKLKSHPVVPQAPQFKLPPNYLSPAIGGNKQQTAAPKLPSIGVQTQSPSPIAVQLFPAGLPGTNSPSPQLHRHVFIPLWTVWTALATVAIAALCLGAAALGSLVH